MLSGKYTLIINNNEIIGKAFKIINKSLHFKNLQASASLGQDKAPTNKHYLLVNKYSGGVNNKWEVAAIFTKVGAIPCEDEVGKKVIYTNHPVNLEDCISTIENKFSTNKELKLKYFGGGLKNAIQKDIQYNTGWSAFKPGKSFKKLSDDQIFELLKFLLKDYRDAGFNPNDPKIKDFYLQLILTKLIYLESNEILSQSSGVNKKTVTKLDKPKNMGENLYQKFSNDLSDNGKFLLESNAEIKENFKDGSGEELLNELKKIQILGKKLP